MTGALADLPADLAKLAVWRHGLPNPTTFLVTEKEGREALEAFNDHANGVNHVALLAFDTYNDGSGRRSTTTLRMTEVAGLTLEFASIQLASAKV